MIKKMYIFFLEMKEHQYESEDMVDGTSCATGKIKSSNPVCLVTRNSKVLQRNFQLNIMLKKHEPSLEDMMSASHCGILLMRGMGQAW